MMAQDCMYYRARYYRPRLQRFIAEDPIGFAWGDANLYAYAQDNPLRYNDPSGYCPWCLGGAALGMTLNVVSQLAANGGNLGAINVSQVGLAAASWFLRRRFRATYDGTFSYCKHPRKFSGKCSN